MTTLQQIECVQNNIEDLSIAIQDRLEDADRALTEIPVLIAQRSQERNHLAKLLERRAAELEQLERFEKRKRPTLSPMRKPYSGLKSPRKS